MNEKPLFPKCVQLTYDKSEKEVVRNVREIAYINSGYLLPCCWLDGEENKKFIKSLLKEKLKVENVDNVEDIITSEEWIDWFDVLINRPEEAKPVCYRYCRSPRSENPLRRKRIGTKDISDFMEDK